MSNPPELRVPDDFRARWKARFEHRAASREDDAGIAGWTRSGLEARVRSFQRHWTPSRPNALWLDIGCGAGTYTRFLQSAGVQAVGMDYSVPSLHKARVRSPASMAWVAADVTRLPVKTGEIDGVLCLGVIQALPATKPALTEIARALKPGGTLWIDFLNALFVPTRIAIRARMKAGKPAHLRYETEATLTAALRECGYEIVAVHWVPILPPALRWLQPFVEARPISWLLRRAPRLAAASSHSVLVAARRSSSTG